ncbi:unnamed protein product [Brassicogethes aeneus]|uniref:Biogenesis of lysosome-related organelles complex 1 subunit 4 n=1 Tax=Brassicogethes aeneus TaxID=1431903 RepID=A0A9P0AP52_BRAAE|nr:unnamed protein product [Brassicogethes aeneus]
MVHEKVSSEFSALCKLDVEQKLQPVLTSVDDMLARLEELETILTFAKQDRQESDKVMKSIARDLKQDVNDLCAKIDGIESLVGHITNNLDALEENICKYEHEMGVTDGSSKVSQMFIPLFKKTPEKKSTNNTEMFKTENYFK